MDKEYYDYKGSSLEGVDLSDWQCQLFGCGEYGIVYTPSKGKEPNIFWRWMQYICFGNKWVRRKNEKVDIFGIRKLSFIWLWGCTKGLCYSKRT